ncbi:hypothetical protein B0F90DRAFT_1807503 [Multifurca ochricompacta]|uniref:C2H2-type domain-containing protein n=1 Tax=Multifurca ochricompacta TaxID=376703 RepID=A0AAD4MDD9_9AGAM|nr:hypothetical protein B0F90DRAFT_1807503 [Multifurca ochricompacta]
MTRPKLPSVLQSQAAVQDVSTTKDQINTGLAKATNPSETPIFICAFTGCNRLFPSRERIMSHRKRDHDSEDDGNIITWNE